MKPWQPVNTDGHNACVTEITARECALVMTIVAHQRGVKRRDLFAASRCNSGTAEARQIAMYLCHTLLDISLSEVGRYFGRHRTTVSHACTLVEDRREDGSPQDLEILHLESEIERRRTGRVGHVPAFKIEDLHHG